MHGRKTLLILLAAAAQAAEFSGARALESTGRIVAFGPRPPGSPALARARAYIVAQLKATRCQLIPDKFTATTPNGPLPMENIICKFPAAAARVPDKAMVISGHYDTKLFEGFKFVGANDGGASAGFLLEMARALAGVSLPRDIYLVWFDGEEAIKEWSETDGLHGSRHLAQRWKNENFLGNIGAMVNVDMIGDKDLDILNEASGSRRVRARVWQIAAELGYSKHFLTPPMSVEDDHVPFIRMGVPAIDLIDFNYGPNNAHWHTAADTVDKLAASSFDIVGKVLMKLVTGPPVNN